jgi:hypothetical protein
MAMERLPEMVVRAYQERKGWWRNVNEKIHET